MEKKKVTSKVIVDPQLEKNPAVMIGDKILFIEGRNGQNPQAVGEICEVISGNTIKRAKTNFNAKILSTGYVFTVYYTGPADTFAFATRENEILCIREELESIEEKKKQLEQRLDFLTKYSSEEEYVAHKLDALLSAHDKKSSKEDRIKTMTLLLKELKQSNLL